MIEVDRRVLDVAEVVELGMSLDYVWTEVSLVDEDGIDSGVRHEAVPKPGTPPDNEQKIRAQIEAGIDRMETDAGTAAAWNALTAPRRQETTRLAVLGVAKIARLVLRRLDNA